jgi:hypothetical protein
MKYQCLDCKRVYRASIQAYGCCRHSVIRCLPDDQVTLCPIDGDACQSPGCVHCQGTGYMLKQGVSSDVKDQAAQGA